MKKGLLLIATILVAVFHSSSIFAQGTSARDLKPLSTSDVEPIVCYFIEEDMFTAVPFRADLEALKAARTESATFEVTYYGFSPDQQAAFQYAVDIWASLLQSDVPIRILVSLGPIESGAIATTGITGVFANFKNAQKINAWYVPSMAEKIAGEQLNDPEEAEIAMTFNSQLNYYTGTDRNTPSGQYDLVTIALHEIAHGLGFYHTTYVNDNGIGDVFSLPSVYDRFLENGDQENIIDTYDAGTRQLGNQLTGGDLYFNSFSFAPQSLPRIYAPTQYSGGSSISHLNEDTYPSGNANSLMTPSARPAEAIHDPGLSLEMLEDMGWISMDIDHDALLDTEDRENPYPIIATAKGDNSVAADGVNLHYTYTNWDNEVIVPMTATTNPDEFSAEIPSSASDVLVSYYISVDDNRGRTFTNPGEALIYPNRFAVAPDTIPPDLLHQPLSVVFENDPIAKIQAVVEDNLGANALIMTYRINEGTTSDIEVPINVLIKDGYYRAEHLLNWDLGALGVKKGDLVEYKLKVTDASSNANQAIHPSEDIGFNEIQIDALNEPVSFYQNDFNATTEDFIGLGFEIGSYDGFTSGIMHSDHPYRPRPGISPEDTLIIYQMLKTPIIISEFVHTLSFDEVVLVEPGEQGSQFGDDDFWDYVIVEGSSDLGVTWLPLNVGYDARANSAWLNHYNSDLVMQDFNGAQFPNSEAVGDQSLLFPREIDILETAAFDAGDEILIRFKLYADQLATGWGWAIDNLKIQLDDEKPEIAHIATDYLAVGATELSIIARVTDNTVLDSIIIELEIDGTPSVISFDEEADIYDLTVGLNPVSESSMIKYRIIAVDSASSPNTTYLPEIGFFEIPIAVIGEAKSFYENDFNTESNDFYGANYKINTETGFDNAAIHSLHPYSNSPQETGSMSYLLKYPIATNSDHAWMSFDEVALVNTSGDGATVEVSKDNGATWHAVVEKYGSNADNDWNQVFFNKDPDGNSLGSANQQLYRKRLVDLIAPDAINGGDEVLVRFTLEVNDKQWAWGWTIDNLEIQGVTTSVTESELANLELYPNPAENGRFRISGTSENGLVIISVMDMTGKSMLIDEIRTSAGRFDKEYSLKSAQQGIYLVTVKTGNGISTARLILR